MINNTIPKPIDKPQIKYSGLMIEILHQKMQIGDKIKIFERARRSPGVRVMIVKNNSMLITKEYRTEIHDWDFRLPGGKVFDSLQEYKFALTTEKNMLLLALEAAKKEVDEETGLIVDNINHFATSNTGGPTVEWDMFYFVADRFHKSHDGQKLELGENIVCMWMDFEEVKKICLNGSIREERTVANILKYLFQYIYKDKTKV